MQRAYFIISMTCYNCSLDQNNKKPKQKICNKTTGRLRKIIKKTQENDHIEKKLREEKKKVKIATWSGA